MRNLRVSARIRLLVAVLLATSLVVGAVGVVQLTLLEERFERMANTTSKAVWLTGDGRIELLMTIRAEKNAILMRDKTRAEEFAAEGRQSGSRLQQIRSELESLVGVNVATPEGRAMSELNRALDEFGKNSKEVLRLAVIKSNVEGERLVGDLYQQLRDLEEFVRNPSTREAVRGLADAAGSQPTFGGNLPPSRQAAAEQVTGQYCQLLFRLTLHLDSTDDQEKNRLDPRFANVS